MPMPRHATFSFTPWLLAGSALASACTQVHPNHPQQFGLPDQPPGVLVASARLVPGVSGLVDLTGTPDDCAGPGSGVLVETTLGEVRHLYGQGAQPCAPAQVLFDGRTISGQRPADPGLAITFHDSLGPVMTDPRGPDVAALPADVQTAARQALQTLTPLPPIQLTSALVTPTAAQIALAQANSDPLVATLQSWQAADETLRQRARQRAAEADAAALRDVQNVGSDQGQRAQADQLALVAAQLRARERQLQEEQRRQQQVFETSADNRAITAAARAAYQQREAELAQQLAAAKTRAAQFEQLAARLSDEKRRKEETYQQQVQTLNANLKTATQQAEVSRRELVLQAAAKIAEAEALAMAARKQEQEIKLREAARLKAEAEATLDKALALEAGRTVLADLAPAAPPAAPLQLGVVPVVLQAKDLTPEELITRVLKLAEPQAGAWTADWQLSAQAKFLLSERWSLIAEAPVQQVLAQFAQQVQQTHGFSLRFTQFAQSRLLVVTDVQESSNKQ